MWDEFFEKTANWPLWLKLSGVIAFLISADIILAFSLPGIKTIPIIGIFICFFGFFYNGFSVSKPPLSALLLILLVLFAIPGLIQNKINGQETSYFTCILQLLFSLSVLLIPANQIRSIDLKHFLKFLNILGWIFVISRILVLIIYPSTSAAIHELAFIIPLFLIPSLYSKNRSFIAISMFFAAILFLINPRTTMFLVYSITFLFPTLLLLIQKVGFKTILWVSFASLALILIFLSQILGFISEIDKIFKTSLGKNSNASFRQYMIVVGLVSFLKSPVYGMYFSGGTGYSTKYEGGRELPLHNDMLDVAVQGGVIGLFLFIGGIFGLFVSLNRILQKKSDEIDDSLRILIITISTSLLTGLITILFNPIINSTKTGFFFFFIIGVSILLIRYVKLNDLQVSEIKINKI